MWYVEENNKYYNYCDSKYIKLIIVGYNCVLKFLEKCVCCFRSISSEDK